MEADQRTCAAAWRKEQRLVSRRLASVGPNAMLLDNDDLLAEVGALKAGRDGEIEVAGHEPLRCLTALGLFHNYRIYLCTRVVWQGNRGISLDRGRRSDWSRTSMWMAT